MNDVVGSNRRGFTLIELLIVVLIIAILAAIAVPNFLEFQTRAKVSRTMADQRSIATAIEAYCVDTGEYSSNEGNLDSPSGLIRLSTPIAYMTNAMLVDPFKPTGSLNTNNQRNLNFIYLIIEPKVGWNPNIRPKFTRNFAFPEVNGHNMVQGYPGPYKWVLVGYGPDHLMQFDDDRAITSGAKDVHLPYDPTNGTVSTGDIYRWGPGT